MLDDSKEKALKSFAHCAALYAAYSRTELPLRRAHLQGSKTAADPLDFTIDIALKVKRVLGNTLQYAMVLRQLQDESTLSIPEHTRQRIGQAFIDYKLEEDYAQLFAQGLQSKRQSDAEDYRLCTELSREQIESAFEYAEPAIDTFGESTA